MTAAVVALLVIGGAVVLLRRKRGQVAAADPIRIVASRSLGGKAKVVLLAAGGRELLVAIDGRGTRLLARWRADEDEAAEASPSKPDLESAAARLRRALGSGPLAAVAPVEPAPPVTPSSSAVSGLLRLRQKLSGPDAGTSEWERALMYARSEGNS